MGYIYIYIYGGISHVARNELLRTQVVVFHPQICGWISTRRGPVKSRHIMLLILAMPAQQHRACLLLYRITCCLRVQVFLDTDYRGLRASDFNETLFLHHKA